MLLDVQIDQKIEEMFASRKRVSEVTKPVGFVPGANNPVVAPSLQQQAPSADNLQKLEIAKKLASQIHAAKNLGGEQDNTQQVAAAILRGDMSTPQISVCINDLSRLFHILLLFILCYVSHKISATFVFTIALADVDRF